MGKDPYKYYRVEAHDLLDALTRLVTELDGGAADKTLVAQVLRLAHTLKGASQVVKQASIAGTAHAIEDILCPFRESEGRIPKASTAEALQLLDNIAADLDLLGAVPASNRNDIHPTANQQESLKTVRIDVSDVDALLSNLSEAAVQVTALRHEAAALHDLKQLAGAIVHDLSHSEARQNGSNTPKTRMDAERLLAAVSRVEQTFVSAVEWTGREILESQGRAQRLRLLPVETIFPALQRSVREAARSLGKQIDFQTSGPNARLDADVLAILQDCLLHLVRNAVDHGIEGPELRTARGKPSPGKVEVKVERSGGYVDFVCGGDAGGFNVEAIRKSAVKSGVIPAADAESLSLDDAVDLLLHGGVSTANAVTKVSGRGIGLDVVRDAVARMSGKLSIKTVPGAGTTVQIRVPVSLNFIHALLVESTGISACIPMDSVRQTIRIGPREITRSGTSSTVLYKNQAIPFLTLSDVLHRPGDENGNGCKAAVVVQSGQATAAVGVSRLLGARSILVRSLPAMMAADPIIAGGTIDAAGNPVLVLDPEALARGIQGGPSAAEAVVESRRLPILVIDDSVTTRMVEQNILETAGHEVDLASSAEEALEMTRTRDYALFLVDVEMPGMDGFQFLKRVYADPRIRGIPSIMMTSRSALEDKRHGAEVGADAYIVKGEFDQRHFLATVTHLLE